MSQRACGLGNGEDNEYRVESYPTKSSLETFRCRVIKMVNFTFESNKQKIAYKIYFSLHFGFLKNCKIGYYIVIIGFSCITMEY